MMPTHTSPLALVSDTLQPKKCARIMNKKSGVRTQNSELKSSLLSASVPVSVSVCVCACACACVIATNLH